MELIVNDTGPDLGRILGFVFVSLLVVGLLALEARRQIRKRRR